jgi:hypothetical protein
MSSAEVGNLQLPPDKVLLSRNYFYGYSFQWALLY